MSNKIKLTYGIFKEKISNKNLNIKGNIKIGWKVVFWFFIIGILLFFISNINFRFAKYGFNLFWENIGKFFNISNQSLLYGKQNLFALSFSFLFYSIKITFLGTAIGVILAFITSYFSNYKMVNKYIAGLFKIITTFLRILPELIFIYIFSISFDKTLAITLILSWFTWLWLHEYFSQAIENIDFSIFYHLTKIKKSKFMAFYEEIWPQIKMKFTNYIFYAFESNLRWNSILSKLGFLGIGILLNVPELGSQHYSNLFIPLFVLISFLFLLEIIHIGYTELFLETKTLKIKTKEYEKNNLIKKVIKVLIFTLFITLIALSIKLLIGQKYYKIAGWQEFKNFFNPNWNDLHTKTYNDNNIFKIIIEFISLITISTIFTYIISFLKLFFINNKINNKNISLFLKFINTFIRGVPIIVLFFIFNPIFIGNPISFVIAFSIHSASSLVRNLENSINKIDQQKINNLTKQGWSKWKIYNKFIVPTIKLDFITFITFEIEKITRNFISYGIYASCLLGIKSTLSISREMSDIASYLWIGVILIAITNLISYSIRYKVTNNYSFFNGFVSLFNKKRVINPF
ncbi:ABC transporter permease subunit [Metamycoplasma buccale]|uniref:ABC transporter permease subunit n=1 Tax=Metamycoplasma buccale TaxID=55602 RepID=UPI00398ED637